MPAVRFSPRRRTLLSSLPLLVGGAVVGSALPFRGPTPAFAQAAGCDPTSPGGCELVFREENEGTLAQGTDVHMWRFKVPVAGKVGMSLYTGRDDADLDIYITTPNRTVLGEGTSDNAKGRRFEYVEADVAPGEYRVHVQINASRNRSVSNVEYDIEMYGSKEIWTALQPPTAGSQVIYAGLGSRMSAALNGEAPVMATASTSLTDTGITIRNVTDGQGLLAIPGAHRSSVFGFDTAGRLLAYVGDDNTVNVCNLSSGQVISTLTGITDPISALAMGANDSLVAIATKGNLQVRTTKDGRGIWSASTGDDTLELLLFSRDHNTIAGCHYGRTVRRWKTGENGKERPLTTDGAAVSGMAFSRDAKFLAVADWDRGARIWRLEDATEVGRFTYDGDDGMNDVGFSPDGRFLAGAGSDETIRIWQVSDGALVKTITTQCGDPDNVMFMPDGRRLMTWNSDDATIRMWDIG